MLSGKTLFVRSHSLTLLLILFVLTLAFGKAVLYENVLLSTVALSTKNDTPVFRKKFSFFTKLVSKLKH